MMEEVLGEHNEVFMSMGKAKWPLVIINSLTVSKLELGV